MTRGSRTRVSVASLLLGMTALTGCAAEPLAPEDVAVSVTVDVPEQTIIGDSAEIEGAAVLPEGRDDPIDTVLEVRAPGGQWAAADSSIALDAAGQWGFRTVVRLPDIEGDFAVSSVTTIEVSDLQALVRDLYYNQRIAFQAGPEAGWDYRVAANYPGIWDPSAASAAEKRDAMITDGYWVNAVPDLASLTPDPEWVLSSIDPSCSVPPSAPVEGRTFTLTISETWGLNAYGYQSNQETSQVHVTLLDGDVYFFTSLCW